MKIILTCCCLLALCNSHIRASEFGGPEDAIVKMSPKLAQVVERGLAYLASTQNPDGSWSGSYGKNVGEVSLALMAFMSAGNLPGEGKYGATVGKGVNWILEQCKPNGLIQFTEQSRQAPVMYGHALATLMLSEVWGQSRHRGGANDVGVALRNACNLIVRVQGKKGGWGYKSTPTDGDTSICVMQVFALKSSQEAGIYVPEETITKALQLIKTRYDAKEKGFGYNKAKFELNHIGSSAAGTCIMQICGETDPKYTIEPLNKIHDIIEKTNNHKKWPGHGKYVAYYATVCSYAAGEKYYARWMKVLEPHLIKSQKGNGSYGQTYNTAFAILAAAMPYRYMPIYQR